MKFRENLENKKSPLSNDGTSGGFVSNEYFRSKLELSDTIAIFSLINNM